MKKNILKSIAKLFMVIVSLSLASCAYEDFVENEFDFTSVYLPYEQIDRSFIMGEGMRIGVGAVLGGRLDNTEDVEITFSLDDDLVTNAGKSVLPSNYYELVDSEGNPSNNKIIIPAGKVQGFVYVKADSINFLGDALSLGNNYALGFTLENVVNADSILVDTESTKYKSSLITFTYINQLYGHYFQKGQVVKTEGASVETITYVGDINNNENVELTMVSPNTVQCNGLALLRESDKKMNLVIADDNSITIESVAGAVVVTDNDGSFYDPATRTITLNYSFESNGATYVANDVLEFRNREVDGVNQIGI